jgi:hypothetical protein
MILIPRQAVTKFFCANYFLISLAGALLLVFRFSDFYTNRDLSHDGQKQRRFRQ